MKKLIKISSIAILLAFATTTLSAQKFGHLNSGNLLLQVPATKVADEKLKALQDSLIAAGEAKAKVAQEEYMAFMKEYNEGNVPPIQAQKKQAEFQQKEEELAGIEDEIVATISQKRKELLGPILDQLQKALDEIGKEGGYTLIFDTSVFNTILFAKDSDDIEPLVKAKMGLK